jgi:AraC-like DNA-binding protein
MSFSGTVCGLLDQDHDIDLGHLHLLRAGRMTVQPNVGDPVHLAEPGLVLLPRPLAHTLSADIGGSMALLCATIDLGHRGGSPIAMALPAIVALPFATLPSLHPALELLFSEFNGTASGRQAALDRLLEYILILLLRHQVEAGSSTTGVLAGLGDRRLARSLRALHEQPQRAWTLQALAEEAGMSRARFAERFPQVLGVTPMAYLAAWRLNLAKDLLLRGRPVKAVAAEAGYSGAAAFTRAFVRSAGVPPTEWLAHRSTPR